MVYSKILRPRREWCNDAILRPRREDGRYQRFLRPRQEWCRMRRGDVTGTRRRTQRRARASAVRPAHARRGRRRSVGSTTRSRLCALSVSPVSALREPSRQCDEGSSGSQQQAASSSSSSQQQATPSPRAPSHPPQPVCFFFDGPGTTGSHILQAWMRDDDPTMRFRKAMTYRGGVATTVTPRSCHGLGTAGPPHPLKADPPATWVTKLNNQRSCITDHRTGGFLTEKADFPAGACVCVRARACGARAARVPITPSRHADSHRASGGGGGGATRAGELDDALVLRVPNSSGLQSRNMHGMSTRRASCSRPSNSSCCDGSGRSPPEITSSGDDGNGCVGASGGSDIGTPPG